MVMIGGKGRGRGRGSTYLTDPSTEHTRVGRVFVLPEQGLGREGLALNIPSVIQNATPALSEAQALNQGHRVILPYATRWNAFDSQEGRLIICAQMRA